MTNSRLITIVAAAAGVILLVVAGVYFAEPAKSLPSFFPGYDATGVYHHNKHGIAALLVALACFAFVWFQSGPKSARA
jgi:drug/metabolite transporter (DMT)-like permease